jgi:LytS/YehU family sensor histidine kinase
MSLLAHTLRGIAAQRRAIPIAIVCLPMVLLEGLVAGLRGVVLAPIVFGAFLVIGPVSYRALFPERRPASHRIARVLAFAAVDLVYVALFGLLLPRLLQVRDSIFTNTLTLYAAGPLFWAGSWALGRDIEWEASLRAERARNEALEREAERAQLLALRAHLDPHFLFNTLNAIAEWCREDPAVAERATLQLSGMLRTILTGVKAAAWPFREELVLARQLLELHQTRDAGRFMFAIDASPESEAIPVPPMSVLSLIENAVKHGPAAGHAGRIELSAAVVAGRLRIAIRNPGPYRGRRDGGEGLGTVEKRLQLAYRGQATMTHASDDTTTTATLDLPLQLDGGAA